MPKKTNFTFFSVLFCLLTYFSHIYDVEKGSFLYYYTPPMHVHLHNYTGVVNPKPTIGKPCNGQRNVHYCMRGTKTEKEKNIK